MARRRQALLIAILENVLAEFDALLRAQVDHEGQCSQACIGEALSEIYTAIFYRLEELAAACGLGRADINEVHGHIWSSNQDGLFSSPRYD